MMSKKKTDKKTSLTAYDKVILDRYTKYYTNFIESSTVKNDTLENSRHTPKK